MAVRHVAVAVAAVAIASGTLAGCDDGERASETATTPTETNTRTVGGEMAVVLSHDRCTYVGNRSPPTGLFAISVENWSSSDGEFFVVEPLAGATRAQLADFVNDWHRLAQAGGGRPPGGRPMWTTVDFAGTHVPAGGRSELPVNGPNRVTYAVVCMQGPTLDGFVTPHAVYLATFLTVGQ